MTKDVKSLLQQKYGRWTVIGDVQTEKNRAGRLERRWLCRCECGAQRYVLERSLLNGGSKSCGCQGAENRQQALSYDLLGRCFGDLTVLGRADDHPKDARSGIWWHCRCECGQECDLLASLLVTGKKTHCGCKSVPKKIPYKDIGGQRFNRLTALYPIRGEKGKGRSGWHCRCDCGKEIDVSYNSLVYCNLQSCGCQKREHDQLLPSLITHVDGTSVDMLRSKKLPSDNTSGVRGVYLQKGKWMAKIVFQKKQYLLGKYATLEEAAEVRRAAEELLFDGAVAHYEKWRLRADADPTWAAENPVQILVTKKSASELQVVFLPPIA